MRIGIDIGGTFTDFVIYDPGSQNLETFKLLSTPHDPAEAVLHGLEKVRQISSRKFPEQIEIIHGSTIATNALLERKGALCALVTTQGFKDLLQIGRQNRPALYDLLGEPQQALIPPGLRFEVNERVNKDGDVLQPIDLSDVDVLIPQLKLAGVESAAVCFLFSFLHPEHEAQAAARLSSAGIAVSISSEILPEFREYERISTTVVNAFVSPILDRYLEHLSRHAGSELRVMQSNGGSLSLDEARRLGVHSILSGPAGGIIGAQQVSDASRLITFDMGGTSTDVSLVDGQPHLTYEAIIGGCPIHIPLLDIHTIGAGGGSIAHCDAGGALRVGPQSAGALPGPACYGRNVDPRFDLPTVTDANLVLGRLAPELFLDGELLLYPDRSLEAMERLGGQIGLDAQSTAQGVIDIACAHMEQAIRLISVERGYDPRDFSLLSFGGAGGLHAAELARRSGIPQVIVPPLASTLSAFGMLAADVIKDYSQTVMLNGEASFAEIQERMNVLAQRGWNQLRQEGMVDERIRVEPALDMRLRGQSYELTVPFTPEFLQLFHDQHNRTYGYCRLDAPVEIVTLRLRAVGKVDPPVLTARPAVGPDSSRALLDHRPAALVDNGRLAWRKIPFYRGEFLQPGNRLAGPAVVVRSDTTIWLGIGDEGEVDGYGNLWLAVSQD